MNKVFFSFFLYLLMTSCLNAISIETGVSFYEEELSNNKISIGSGIHKQSYDISAQFNSPFFDIAYTYRLPFIQFTGHYRNSKNLFNQYDLVMLASYSINKDFLSFYIKAGLQFSLLSINEVPKNLFNVIPSYNLNLSFIWESITINLFVATNTKFWFSGQTHGLIIGEDLKIKFTENLDLKLISQLKFSDFLTENIFTCAYQYGFLVIWNPK